MTEFHQFTAVAASRREGLHPKLVAVFERTAAAPFSDVVIRRDGLIQSGPDPVSEIVSSRAKVTVLPR
jgi:hypothetical protein